MAFLHAFNAQRKNWWDSVTLIVWGPSAKLLSGDPELQKKIEEPQEVGVKLEACKPCADEYGVSNALQSLGADVKYSWLDRRGK